MTPRVPEVRETTYKDGTHALVIGRYRVCRVKPNGGDSTSYTRITQNGSKHGRRYHWHETYQDAIDAAMAWANRKLRNR